MPIFNSLNLLGVPSSAGAYAPGQEMAPSALRNAGLVKNLQSHGFHVNDLGDLPLVRWRVDRENPDAMNVESVAKTARATAEEMRRIAGSSPFTLVLGGDCTIEVGVVAGSARGGARTGLVYMDLDADLNTPKSTTDGALDWMGVAHLLDLEDCVNALAGIGDSRPLMNPRDICFFGCRNMTPFEREIILTRDIKVIPFEAVVADPPGAAAEAIGWCRSFDEVLVHFDVDIIDFADFPIAENTRRHCGMTFDGAMRALEALMQAPNIAVCTVTEINPFHCDYEPELIGKFAARLAEVVANARRLRS